MTYFVIAWVWVAALGAAIGSFLTLVTYRLPREQPIGLSRSRCPACGTTLTVRDLFPILSWVVARGKCRHCKTRISVRYPLTELACAAGALAAVAMLGFTLEAFAVAGLWWCIVAITITDLEHYIILDEVQIALVVFGVLYHVALGTDAMAVASAAIIGLAIGLSLKYGFMYLRKKDGLGMGDVKLLCGAGVWLASSISFVPFLFFAGVLGIAFGVVWRVLGRGQMFPFGPALAASLWVCVLWPVAVDYFWQLCAMVAIV
jgi:prepilin signal peptidase PulO-like enzyme (type II secretory pathway)